MSEKGNGRIKAIIKYRERFGKPVPSCGFWPSEEEILHAVVTGVELDPDSDCPFMKSDEWDS